MEEEKQIDFTPFQSRTTHWGPENHRPLVRNVATVLPPGLPPSILKTLLLRMQLEDAQYNLLHIKSEWEYINWLDSSMDFGAWNGEVDKALYSRAKANCLKEIQEVNKEVESLYPNILPNPPQ